MLLWYSDTLVLFRLALCVPCLQGNKTEIRKLQVVDIQLIRRFSERIFQRIFGQKFGWHYFFLYLCHRLSEATAIVGCGLRLASQLHTSQKSWCENRQSESLAP